MDFRTSPPADRTEPDKSTALERIEVAGLFKTAREVVLVHDGQDYRLRLTAKGKLILTK